MANEQVPPAVQQNNPEIANVNATNDDPLTPITMFLRFLYTGSTASSIPVKSTTAPNLRDIANTLACVIDMATALPNLPVSTIRKVSVFFQWNFFLWKKSKLFRHFLLIFLIFFWFLARWAVGASGV